MSEQSVHFFSEDTDFKFSLEASVGAWLSQVAQEEGHPEFQMRYIFCSDPYILQINIEYLSHDYYTDVITFPMSEGGSVEADVFISVDTVRSNAKRFGVAFQDELLRVIVHALLHMLGYDDKSEEDAAVMREKENYYLAKYKNKE